MSSALPLRNTTAVKAGGGSRWFSVEECEGNRICQKGFVQGVFGFERDPTDYLEQGKTITPTVLIRWMLTFAKRGLAGKRKKSPFSRTCHLYSRVSVRWKTVGLRV
ncbi:hypothetical protein TNIN_349001 [Trichonephila inaurata madagascariensis]|uniref:Uncharacterized protein n=1 Tax=Trichonephila inaurata madagascariensis TaxID=2747483 RepID=A0A8X7BTR8_9ARAC|nr:hypothetical protein TNIN_349001 [Trichonephila inaurata madagascariensis]